MDQAFVGKDWLLSGRLLLKILLMLVMLGLGLSVSGVPLFPLSLPTYATAQFERFLDCGRAVRCMLPLGCGRFLHFGGAVWVSGC